MTTVDEVKAALDQAQADLTKQSQLITAKAAADATLQVASIDATAAAQAVTDSHQKIHDDQVKLTAMIADLLGGA